MPPPSPSQHDMEQSVGAMPDAHPPKCNNHDHDNDLGPVQVLRVSGPSHGYAPAPHASSPSPQAKTINKPTGIVKAGIPANRELVTTQPTRIHDLSMEEAAPPPGFIADLERRHRSNVFQRCLFSLKRGCNLTIYNTPLALFIVLSYWLPTSIFIICVGCLFLAVFFAWPAAYGAIVLVLGNVILRTTHHAHYTNNAAAAAIGAVGGVPASLCYTAIFSIIYNIFKIPPQMQGHEPIYIAWPVATVLMTLTGVLGVSLLKHHQVDIGDIDVLHGARAGALGGALFGPVAILAGASIALALGILLTPLWAAMLLGFRWAYGHSSETWRGDGNSYCYTSSYCFTSGGCGDDPDIADEARLFRQRGANNRP